MATLPGEKGMIAIATVTVLVAGFLGVRAYRKNKAKRDSRKEGKELERDINSDIKNIKKPPTATQTNFKLLSDRLYKSLNRWIPDVTQVYQVFAQMNNERDIYELIKSFGMKLDSSNGADDDVDANLSAFIQKLDGDELDALNMMIARKGIKFRF